MNQPTEALKDDPDAIADRAKRYSDLGRHAEAERIARRGLHAHPEHFRLLEQLSFSLHMQDRYEEDLEVTRSMMVIAPESPWAFFHHGWSLSTLNRRNEAIEVFAEGLRIDPHLLCLQHDYANLLRGENRTEEALKVVTGAMADHPHDSRLPRLAGLCLMSLDRRSEAHEQLTAALALNPDDADTWYRLGWNHMMLNHARPSIDAFARSVSLEPDHGWRTARIRYMMPWPLSEIYTKLLWTIPFMGCVAMVFALVAPSEVWPVWIVATGLAAAVAYSAQWGFRGGVPAWRALFRLPWSSWAWTLAGIAVGCTAVALVMLGSLTANPLLIGMSGLATAGGWLAYAADRVTDPGVNQEGPLPRRLYKEMRRAITYEAAAPVRLCRRVLTRLRNGRDRAEEPTPT